jgi:RNA polymerase sigma-32 factor
MGADERVDLDPAVLAEPFDEDDPQHRPAATAPTTTTLVASRPGRLAPAEPLDRYLSEIRKYPPLTRDEERELAREYRRTGSREALFRLVTANLMMVVRVALSFRRAARNLLDLIQEGNLGLLQAIERFDPELGVRLPTYAAWWVRAYMVKFLLDNVRLVRVGTTNARRKLLRNLRREKQRLESQGYDVGPRLLAERFGVSEEDVKDVEMALHSRDVSIDAPIGDAQDDGRTLAAMLPAAGPDVEESIARRELQQRFGEVIAQFREHLTERERSILDHRLLSESPLTLQQLGDRFGTTREAVRQAEARLKTRLTAYLRQELGDLRSVQIGAPRRR